ncbi:hypothetical protein ACFQRB_07125 [Halobaculum litoreum]|uniref:Uncharacterized protein n=1 Tax=Halobaculum litoreum TaxID=3031998 RepID=A0ABD5XRE6_9EURY
MDHVGDCEDYAALLAGVVAAPPFDLDPALVLLPGHVGVGVDPDAVGADGLPTLRVAGREYLYLDATYRVGLGTLPADHDEGVVAVRDGGWLVGDPGAFAAHVREAAALHAAARRPASR